MQSGGARLFLRIVAVIGFLATMVAALYSYVITALAEGSYEEAVRSKSWEWAAVASVAGGIAAVVAIRGLVVGSRRMVRVGALAQAVSTLVVLVIALRSFESDGPEIEQLFTAFTVKQLFITLAIAVPVFDLAVIVGSWALPRRVRPI